MRNVLAFLWGFALISLVGIATADAAYNPTSTWTPDSTAGSNGWGGYRRNIPNATTVTGQYAKEIGLHGLHGYNNIGTPTSTTVPLSRSAKLPIGTDKGLKNPWDMPVSDKVHVPKSAVSRGVGKAFGVLVPLLGTALLAYDVYKALDDDGIYYDPESQKLVKDGTVTTAPIIKLEKFNHSGTSGLIYTGSPPPNGTLFSGDDALKGALVSWAPTGATCVVAGDTGLPNGTWREPTKSRGGDDWIYWRTQCITNSNNSAGFAEIAAFERPTCPDGYSLQGSVCAKNAKIPQTEDQLTAAVQNDPITDYPAMIDELKQHEQSIVVEDGAQAELQGPTAPYETEHRTTTTTSTNPDGSTSTRTREDWQTVTPQTVGNSVGDQYITYNITNNYRITNENNEVIESQEQELNPPPVQETDEQPEEPPQDYSFSDSSFPALPELYEQKYPDGLQGVWNAKWPQIQQTAFLQGISSMFPDFGGGTCPAFSINLNIMPRAMYGTQTFDLPCWILQAVGLILLTTACFTARSIIFGG